MKVLVGIPSGRLEPRTAQEPAVNAMIACSAAAGLEVIGPLVASGCLVFQNRNRILLEADRLGCDYCLQLDSDMLPPPDLITRLVALDAPVASGLCFLGTYPFAPSVFELVPPEDRAPDFPASDDYTTWPYFPYRSIAEIPDGPFAADAVGGACLLIKRDVWKRLAPRPFQMVYTARQFLSEDLFFCHSYREAFFSRIIVDPAAEVGHLRLMAITRAEFDHACGRQRPAAPPAIPLFVVIPKKRGERDEITRMLGEAATSAGATVLVDESDRSLYAKWNWGCREAEKLAAGSPEWNVAILNNDLVISPDFLPLLATALRSAPDIAVACPEPEPGKQLAGWAFMVRGEQRYRFDEQYEWWYGDDDFARTAVAAGKRIKIVSQACCHHLQPNVATERDPALQAAAERDAARFQRVWETVRS